MRHFPIFLDLTDRVVLVSGAGECAVAKLRLLLKTDAQIAVFGAEPALQTQKWANDGAITLHARPLNATDVVGATLIYAANENAVIDAQVAKIGADAGVLVNIVDNLEDSAFITPAIVDRAPVTVAIGTEGAAPVLARKIKQQLEETLPANLGQLASIGRNFRTKASILPMGRKRRDFWSSYYFKHGPVALAQGGVSAAKETLKNLLSQTLNAAPATKRVFILNAHNGDADLMTIKTRNILHEADVIVHDNAVPKSFLELARREALVVTLDAQHGGGSINSIDVALKADPDAQIMRIIAGDPAPNARANMEMLAINRADVPAEILQTVAAPRPQTPHVFTATQAAEQTQPTEMVDR